MADRQARRDTSTREPGRSQRRKDLPTIRILDYISFMLETGDVEMARRTLLGRHAEETAGANLLSVTSVRKALDRVNENCGEPSAPSKAR